MTVSVNFGVSVGKLVFPSRKSTKRLPLAWCVELNCSLFITRFPFYFFLFVAVQAPSSSLWSWGPFIHYIKANFLMSWKKCGLMSIKSVHFKNPVMRSSFLSKSLSFTIQHQLNQNKVSWCNINIENDNNFERNEDRTTVFLKWTDFSILMNLLWENVFLFCKTFCLVNAS